MRTWDKSKPPTGPFALNRDAPQAENLIAWYPLGGAGKLWVPDYAGSSHLTMGTDPGLTVGRAGAPVLPLVVASSHYVEGVASGMSALPLTVAGWCNTTLTGASGVPICIGTNGGNARIQIQKDTAQRVIGAGVVSSAGSGNTIAFTYGGVYVDNVDFHAAAVYTSSTSRQGFLNGFGSSIDTASVVATGMDRIVFGGRRNSSSVGIFWGGHIGEWGVWAQADDAAMIALRADPGSRFELWYPLRSKRWISLASGTIHYASITEAASGDDVLSAQASWQASVIEAATADSSQTAQAAFAASQTDAATASDAPTASFIVNADITEAATASDAGSAVGVFAASVLESATLSEAATAQAQFVANITEPSAAFESTTAQAQFIVGITEPSSAADTVDGSLGSTTYNVTVTEAGSGNSAQSANAVFNTEQTEAGSASDSSTGQATIQASVTEAAAGADSAVAGAVMAGAVNEAATGADSSTVQWAATASVLESASALDTITAAWTTSATITEAANASETSNHGIVYSVSITEPAGANDVSNYTLSFNVDVLESANAVDFSLVQTVFNVSILEVSYALDLVQSEGDRTPEQYFLAGKTVVYPIIGTRSYPLEGYSVSYPLGPTT